MTTILKIIKIHENEYVVFNESMASLITWHLVYSEFHTSHKEAMQNLNILNNKKITREKFDKHLKFKNETEAIEFVEKYESLCVAMKLSGKKNHAH